MFFLPPPSPAQRRNEFHPSEMKPGARGQERGSEEVKVQGQQGDNSAAANDVVSFE